MYRLSTMAASISHQNKLQLPQANCNSQQLTSAAFGHAFQALSARKPLLPFTSKVDRQGAWLSSKVPWSHPSLTVRCSSHRVRIDISKSTDKASLFPAFGSAHRQEMISSSNFALHGRMHSFAQTSSTETARDTTDDVDKVEGVTTLIAPEVQIGKAVKAQSWLQSVIPQSLWPYAQLARIDKPIGIWLFAWPCLWATSLAAPLGTFPDLKFTALFGLWAFLMRGAACTVNDIFDKDFDGKVERTKSRPLPSGAATVLQAAWFLGLQLLAAALVSSPLNGLSQLLGAVYVLLFCIYPLLKRVTSWPQAFLGVLLSSGFFVAWAAIRHSIDLSIVLPMFASGALWTVVYDTIYAHQDKEDDAKIGVKSTALLFGDNTRAILTGCSVGSVALLALGGLKVGLGWPFYAGVALAAGHLTWQVGTVDLDQPEDCGSKFRSNQWYGAIVWSSIILGNLVAAPA